MASPSERSLSREGLDRIGKVLINLLQHRSCLILGGTGESLESCLVKPISSLLQVLQVLLNKTIGGSSKDSLLENRLLNNEPVDQRDNVVREKNDGIGNLLLVSCLKVGDFTGFVGSVLDVLQQVRGFALELESSSGEFVRSRIKLHTLVRNSVDARKNARYTRACSQAGGALAQSENANEEESSGNHFRC